LHGQRHGQAAGHGAVGLAVPGARTGGLPVGLGAAGGAFGPGRHRAARPARIFTAMAVEPASGACRTAVTSRWPQWGAGWTTSHPLSLPNSSAAPAALF